MTTMQIEYNEQKKTVTQTLGSLAASGLIRRKEDMSVSDNQVERKEALTPIQELLLQAPTWSDEEYNRYVELRKHFSYWRG
jgi:DNA-binding HxlR family transcriptional regulator